MKVERINSANAVLEATITTADIETKTDKLASNIAKTTKIDGFRKGKVPLAVVKERFSDQIKQDAEGEIIRGFIDSALKELNLSSDDMIGEPAFKKYEKTDNGIEISIEFGIKPKIEIVDYLDAIPEVTEVEIKDEDVETRIKELGKAQATLKKVEDRDDVQKGDSVLMDFDGYVDDKAFEGGKAEGHILEIGSGQFIPGFEDQMIGMKIGETKDVMVTFPESYGGKDLAGKEAKFIVTAHEIQLKEEVELNDELAKKMLPEEKEATMDMVKTKIVEQMKSEEMTKLYNDELKPKVVENLLAKFDFDLPNFVVEQEIDNALNNKVRTMTEEEINELKANQEKVEEMREELKDDAVKSVKVTFLIDTLAQKENINVTEDEVMQTLYYDAMMMQQDPQKVIEYYKKNNLLPAVKMSMVEDRLLSHLLDQKMKSSKESN